MSWVSTTTCPGPLPGFGVEPSTCYQVAYLKHGGDVCVLGLHEFPPGRQVAVGEDAPGLQQAESMILQRKASGQEGVEGPWEESSWSADVTCPAHLTFQGPQSLALQSHLNKVELVSVPGLFRQWVRVV